MLYRIIIFLLLNFGGLAIGGLFTGPGVASDWYQNLYKAPWTPPGWVFGAAWTTIMVCFAFYMASAWTLIKNRNRLLGLYIAEWLLNMSWNPIFFKFHQVLLALIVIVALTVVVGYFLFGFVSQMKLRSLWVLPYLLWMLIATSLNFYIFLHK